MSFALPAWFVEQMIQAEHKMCLDRDPKRLINSAPGAGPPADSEKAAGVS